MGGKPVTSEDVPFIDNLRAHSPQIPDVSRGQPDTSGRAPAPPLGFGRRIASQPSILILCPKVAAITSSQRLTWVVSRMC